MQKNLKTDYEIFLKNPQAPFHGNLSNHLPEWTPASPSVELSPHPFSSFLCPSPLPILHF